MRVKILQYKSRLSFLSLLFFLFSSVHDWASGDEIHNSVDVLPNEVLLQIFSKLDMRDRFSSGQVNQRWRSIVQDGYAIKNLFKNELNLVDSRLLHQVEDLLIQGVNTRDSKVLDQLLHLTLNGLSIDFFSTQIIELYEASARTGDLIAINNLGYLYQHGPEAIRNEEKALDLYLTAAERGSVEAQLNAGITYLEGLGTPVNPRKAFDYFMKAAKQDHVRGMYQVALSYFLGRGVNSEFYAGLRYLELAVEKKYAPAWYLLGNLYEKSDAEYNFICKRDIDNKFNKNHLLAIYYYGLAAKQGYHVAQLRLGLIYLKGEFHVPVNREKAIELLTLAAEGGLEVAQEELSRL